MQQRPDIRPLRADDHEEWLRLRRALWPESSAEELAAEVSAWVDQPREAIFVAQREEGGLCGFLEAAIRPCDFNGKLQAIGYVEGWYVDPLWRTRGVGAALMRAAEDWCRSQGCREIHSDAYLDNALSHLAHQRLGFAEAERLVHFRKSLE